uniref:Uncharacterized protein n=1 Tax=Anguilla anguilla TaxID=7936 RepID=A0A0E9SJB6_ANGAN
MPSYTPIVIRLQCTVLKPRQFLL